MAYTLQIHGERRTYPVPNGLYELMSDIAREVLRNQPQDILKFIAEYMEALLETKALAKEAVAVVDDVLTGGEECIALCLQLGITLEEANRAASIIQAAFLGHMARKQKKAKLAASIREKSQLSFTEELNIDEYLQLKKITFLQLIDAVVKIQACWRGYAVRKKLKKEKEEAKDADDLQATWNHDWLWREFETQPLQEEAQTFYKDLFFPKPVRSTQYLPRRAITVDHHKLKTLFQGHKEDYDLLEQSAATLLSISKDTLDYMSYDREQYSDINVKDSSKLNVFKAESSEFKLKSEDQETESVVVKEEESEIDEINEAEELDSYEQGSFKEPDQISDYIAPEQERSLSPDQDQALYTESSERDELGETTFETQPTEEELLEQTEVTEDVNDTEEVFAENEGMAEEETLFESEYDEQQVVSEEVITLPQYEDMNE